MAEPVVDRYARQAKLAEVGAAGQGRIARTVVDVRLAGGAADVAVRYLAGAGVSVLRVRDEALAEKARAIAPAVVVEIDPTLPQQSDGDTFDLRDPVCREVASGASAALRALKAAIGLGPALLDEPS